MKKQIKVAYFPSTATKTLVLGSNGKSLDKYCTKCDTEEDLSTGNYILDGTFLIEDNIQDLLQEEVILKILMDYGEEIFRISKVAVGARYIDIVARQITIAEELTLWLEDVRPTGFSGANTCSYMVDNAIGTKEIEVVSDIAEISTAYYIKMSLYKALHDCDQSFLNIWGGEVLRRGYIENINSHIGIDRGFAIREGKNLTGFECTSNIDNLVTRAQGKGFDGIVGNYIDSPLIGAYNRVYTDVIEYPDVKVKDENTEGYDTLAEAQAELDKRVQEEYSKNGIDKIKASYDINFVQLEKTEEYKNYIVAERVYLGDAIRVYVPKINTDIQVRAMSKKYDILAQKTKGITLSNYIEPKSLSIKQIIERLESMDSTENILQYAIDNASLLIKAGIKNSYVTVRENEIIIGDTKDINTMTKVWRFNNGGLGFSSTGYYGSFDTAITMDGSIVGKFITANSISASQIKTDELVVGTNIAMGVNAIITWANLNEESKINLKGETGIQGIPGLEGSDGIQGIPGADGVSSYTHIAYAMDASGTGFSTSVSTGKTYIGMYVNSTALDSEIYSVYNWTLIKGADGSQGIQGPVGDNGLNSYLHIAYATSSNGSANFSTTISTAKTYIGQYTNNTLADAETYGSYSWTLILGPQGIQGVQGIQGIIGLDGIQGIKGDKGIQGVIGPDGVSSYTHIAYATNDTGANFSSTISTGKTYVGMYVDSNPTDSETYTSYNWSLIKGADGSQGIQGVTGADGIPSYLHIAYATSSNGSVGFSTTVSTDKTYIGTLTNSTSADSGTYSLYSWSLIKGPQGIQGNIGDTGSQGVQGIPGLDGSDANVPSYITSTKITQIAIESPTISAGVVKSLDSTMKMDFTNKTFTIGTGALHTENSSTYTHADGTFTEISSLGLRRHKGGVILDYRFLSYQGSLTFTTYTGFCSGTAYIQLPDEFRQGIFDISFSLGKAFNGRNTTVVQTFYMGQITANYSLAQISLHYELRFIDVDQQAGTYYDIDTQTTLVINYLATM